jgi:glutamate carboxypeptidase
MTSIATPTPEQLETYFSDNMPTYMELLKQMVDINSYTANPAGVNELGELSAGIFATLGFYAEHIQSFIPEFGKHTILTKTGTSGRKIGLVSHLDTVFPPEEEIANNFQWREEGPLIYGPGTNDIKGGTVMIYMMLDAMRHLAPDLFHAVTWVIFLDAAEERDAEDFGQLVIDHLPVADTLGCLIFESGYISPRKKEFKLVIARKGMATYRVCTRGKAAHAGSSHKKGANAIVQMADVVQKIAGFTDYDKDLTFNVGTFQGGTVTNRVPHEATVEVEMRTFDTDIYNDGIDKMLALNDYSSVKSVKKNIPCTVQVEVLRKTAAWSENAGTDKLFATWAAAGAKYGYQAVREQRGGLSDGNHFWHAIPTMDGLGPTGANAHCSERSADGSKEQEFVFKGSFVPKAVVNVLGVVGLVNGFDG